MIWFIRGGFVFKSILLELWVIERFVLFVMCIVMYICLLGFILYVEYVNDVLILMFVIVCNW